MKTSEGDTNVISASKQKFPNISLKLHHLTAYKMSNFFLYYHHLIQKSFHIYRLSVSSIPSKILPN